MHLAYIATGYPYVSHTFIRNEVEALRELGVEVSTFAVSRSDPSEVRSEADRAARETTYAIRPARAWHFLRAHGRALATAPGRYGRTLGTALRMGGLAPRSALWHLFYFAQAAVLWDQCRRRGIRHIHAHFANVASDLALLAAELGGRENGWTWSFTMHGPTEFYDVPGHRLAEKTQSADLVVCISLFARSQLMGVVDEREWANLHVVHCGVDTTRFRPLARVEGAGARARAVRVLNVGRLAPVKGQAVLLEAMAILRARGTEIELRIAGDGPEEARLRAQAERLEVLDSVTFLGALAHETVTAEMARAEIFCLPSFAEGVPVVLMEAMASGLPVVASRIMGIPELVQDGVAGRLVAPGAADALANALEELVRRPDLRGAMGAAGRQCVQAEWDQRRAVDQLEQLFTRRIVSEAGRRVSR